MIKQKRALVLLALVALLVSTRAMAWWNEEWPYRVPVVIDTMATGANVQADVENVTALVKLHSGNFQDFFLVNQDLSDVRFLAADDKTMLDYQVESVDLINQLIYIWVKIPKVSGNLNTERVWMYYGNASAKPPLDMPRPYAGTVTAIYHLNDLQEVIRDSSANGYDIALQDGVSAQAAMIAGGIQFSGVGGLQTPALQALADPNTSGMTISVWVKPEQHDADAALLSVGDTTANLTVKLVGGQLQLSANAGASESAPAGNLQSGSWHQVAVVLDAGVTSLFLDGNPVSQLDQVVLPPGPTLTIGADWQNALPLIGTVDELRVDGAALEQPHLKLQLASQGLMGNLLKFQQGEQLGSGGGSSSFWTIIIGSTESSGWTIIGLLAVMAAISWLVMLGKALYIRSVGKDNFSFLEQYRRHAGEDPALLDQEDSEEDQQLEDSPMLQAVFGGHDHFQSSPIYRVYHRAIQEVHSRMGTSVGARAAGLSPSAVNAIKAVIDAQMIREAQRLNSKMVLLTIAISGGPFLGLMGTVVGVMITFAAIAASGDVNISAIAPGVAAALLTTVAGLVVAIPALFGYNYLATRIKECITDMRVFGDEFITRLAEYYGR